MKLKSISACCLLAAGLGVAHASVPVVQTSLTNPVGAPVFGVAFAGSSTANYLITLTTESDLTGWVALMNDATVFSSVTLTDLNLGTSTTQSLSQAATLTFWGLDAGSYKLTYSFSAVGFGGFVGGLTATPVPEVDAAALALSGLGVMGLLGSRRKKV